MQNVPRKHNDRWVKVPEILEDLGIDRRTWQHWRKKGATPRAKRLPNNELLISRRDYEEWLTTLEEAA